MKTVEMFLDIPVDEQGQFYVENIKTSYWVLTNRKHHRVDGPSIQSDDGAYVWYLNGIRHCLCGPAYYVHKKHRYYINGIQYTKRQYWHRPEVINHTLEKILHD